MDRGDRGDELIIGDEVVIKIPDEVDDAIRKKYKSYENAFAFVTKMFGHGFYILDINDNVAFPRKWLSLATSVTHHDDEFDTEIGDLYE